MKRSLWIALAAALAAVVLGAWGMWPDSGGRRPPPQRVALVLDTDIGVNSAVIAQGAQMAAREYGADLTVSALSGAEPPEAQVDLVREALEEGATGVLLVPAQAGVVDRAAGLCERRRAKLVLLDTCEAYRGGAPYVGTDHTASGAQAAEKLMELTGAKRLLVLTSDDEVSRDRLRGVEQAAARAGVPTAAGRVPLIDNKPCHDGVRQLLKRCAEGGAVLCLDGALTECAAREIEALGLKGRVALAGFDCDQTHISCLEDGSVLFTVLREPLAVGYEGFRRLMQAITWGVPIPAQYVEAKVILRGDFLKPENVRLVFPLIQ